ncbi:MAG: hypothetical protein ACP5OU_02440 [Methanothrix sp.]
MRLLIGILAFLLIIGLTESVQLGGTTGKVLLLGSLSKDVLSQTNASNETNAINQTNTTGQVDKAIDIKSPMGTNPVTNEYKSANSPDSIQANTIAYQFTT